MAGVLFLANGKRARGGKTNKNQFTRKVCYETNKISTDQPVLVGWNVARFLRLYLCSLKVDSDTLVISAQIAEYILRISQ